MNARAALFAGMLMLSMGVDASAHAVFGITGVSGGLLHPLVVPSHIMATGALAILVGQGPLSWALVAAYALGLCAGLGAIALAYVPTIAEQGVLLCALAAGLLVAWGRPVPGMIVAALAAATGLGIGLDSPPEAVSIAEADRTLAATALSGTVLFVALAWLAAQLRRDWQRFGLRIAGSWIAASAIMVLAMRFAAD